MMFCDHFVFYDTCIKLIPVGEVRPHIFTALDFIPIDIRIAKYNPELMFSFVLAINLPHSCIQGRIDRRNWTKRHRVPPCLLDFLHGNIFTGDVAIHALLVQGIPVLHDNVVYFVCELWRSD